MLPRPGRDCNPVGFTVLRACQGLVIDSTPTRSCSHRRSRRSRDPLASLPDAADLGSGIVGDAVLDMLRRCTLLDRNGARGEQFRLLSPPMTLPRAALCLVIAAIASALLNFGVSAIGDEAPPASAPQPMGVVWTERPESVDDLDDEAHAVVEAEVEGIRSGPDLVSAEPGEPAGEERIPTQRIALRTLERFDGQMPDRFDLFKTGSADLYLEDDPPYRVGERYVLFLRPRQSEPRTYMPSAPDGRLLEGEEGEVAPTIEGPVADELAGDTPAEVEDQVSE